ncbi:MAG TPA: L-histidine N(alpha)-methyltransferase, partial [Casimicrobiaceae bacterium]|nr:L-histidine N(alpha)-methyltransferase [Casimicrobiaceae bacterium]
MQRTTARIDTAFRATPRLLDREVSIVDRRQVDAALERAALVAGLLAEPATIAPKYFYDAVGCDLFCKICNQGEYYPTRTEAAIFDRERRSIVTAIGTGKQLVDLGAGDCAKAEGWLRWLR